MASSFINLTQDRPKMTAAMQRHVKSQVMHDFLRKRPRKRDSRSRRRDSALSPNSALASQDDGSPVSDDSVFEIPRDDACSMSPVETATWSKDVIHAEEWRPIDQSQQSSPRTSQTQVSVRRGHDMFDSIIPPIVTTADTDRLINAFVELSGIRSRVDEYFDKDGYFVAPFILFGFGILGSIHPSLLSHPHIAMFKARALVDVKNRLRHMDEAFTDGTLGMICSLIIFEILSGRSEASVHLVGIGRAIAREGGIHNLGISCSVQVRLTYDDMIYAILHGQNSIFTILDKPELVPMSDDTNCESAPLRMTRLWGLVEVWKSPDGFVNFSPLLDFDDHISMSPGLLSEDTIQTLEAMLCLTRHFFAQENCRDCDTCFEALNTLFRRNDATSNVSPSSHGPAAMTTACRLAASIYSRALVLSIPFNDKSNRDDAKSLAQVLRILSKRDELIENMPFILLWLIFVNGAANPRAFSGLLYVRVLRIITVIAFRNTRKMFSNFLWIQKCLRGESWAQTADQERTLECIITQQLNSQSLNQIERNWALPNLLLEKA